MADEPEKGLAQVMARLNEVSDLVGALRAGNLRSAIGSRPVLAAGCDYHCECNQSYCTCRGSVSRKFLEELSLAEFQQIREARIQELRHELAQLEEPEHPHKKP